MSFETTLLDYANAIINIHGKYSQVRYNTKALEIVNDIIPLICESFSKLNPNVYEYLNKSEFVPINDEVCACYKKVKRTGVKKISRSVNPYTGIFTPIIRRIVDPILTEWDQEEPDVVYKRPTSSNSIASKIYKNLTDDTAYSDTYVYDNTYVNGKTTGMIIATTSDISNAKVIMQQYADVITQLKADKAEIEGILVDVPDDQVKIQMKELITKYIDNHWSTYSMIEEYVIEFMENYRTALKDMCIDKPQKKKKVETSESEEHEETINSEEPVETIEPEPVPNTKKAVPSKKATNVIPKQEMMPPVPQIPNMMDMPFEIPNISDMNIPPMTSKHNAAPKKPRVQKRK